MAGFNRAFSDNVSLDGEISIYGVKKPTQDDQIVNKKYVDDLISGTILPPTISNSTLRSNGTEWIESTYLLNNDINGNLYTSPNSIDNNTETSKSLSGISNIITNSFGVDIEAGNSCLIDSSSFSGIYTSQNSSILSCTGSAILGGLDNEVESNYAVIIAGQQNLVSGQWSVIIASTTSEIDGPRNFISSSNSSFIDGDCEDCTIDSSNVCNIYGSGVCSIVSGLNNNVSASSECGIYDSESCGVNNCTRITIIGSIGCTANNVTNGAIIGCNGIILNQNDTTAINNLRTLGGQEESITTITGLGGSTGDYTATIYDRNIICNNTDVAITQTITLPANPTLGKVYSIIVDSTAGGTVTINGNGKNINGAATKVLLVQYATVTIKYNGTQWNIYSQL